MLHTASHLSAVATSVLLASFAVHRLCMLHSAYLLRQEKIEKEAWLRAQCAQPDFYTNMRYHTNICEEVEATARVGALWYALREVAGTLPAVDLAPLAQRLSWPFFAGVALLCLCFPSALISHLRGREDRLPVYGGQCGRQACAGPV